MKDEHVFVFLVMGLAVIALGLAAAVVTIIGEL